MKIIAVDVDGTVANTHLPWLERYNNEYNDNLTEKDWISWDIHKIVKPECGKRIYKYIEDPSLYDDVKPIKGSQEKVKILQRYFRVIFVTTSTLGAAGRKLKWLRDWKFIRGDQENDYVECRDKSLVFSDYLLDDDIKNIQKPVPYGARTNIIYTQPWNKDFLWDYRMKDWNTFYDFR